MVELHGTAPERARQAIKALGGPPGVVKALREYGMTVEITTVQKWRSRGVPWRYAPWVASALDVFVDEVRLPKGTNGK